MKMRIKWKQVSVSNHSTTNGVLEPSNSSHYLANSNTFLTHTIFTQKSEVTVVEMEINEKFQRRIKETSLFALDVFAL